MSSTMISRDVRQELVNLFGDVLAKDDQLALECVNMCQMFKISPNDLFYKWEAYNYTNAKKMSSELTMDSAVALKAQMQRALSMNAGGKATVSSYTPLVSRNWRFGGSSMKINSGLLDSQTTSVAPLHESKRTSNAERAEIDYTAKVVLRIADVEPQPGFRYMYERMSDRSEALDEHIEEIAEIIRAHYEIAEYGDPSSLSEDPITAVGSIVVNLDEITSATPKLTANTIALQTSRSMGSGVIVPLRFDSNVKIISGGHTTGISLFPGAIVALRGKNGGGDWFLVTEILTPPPMRPLPAIGSGDGILGRRAPFSICIASGPYTSDVDLDYHNWHRLLRSIRSSPPDVIILIGPFIDAAHTNVVDGDADHSPASIFQEQIVDHLHAYINDFPKSTFILVPSIRDVMSDPIFPQHELKVPFMLHSNIHLMSNPCEFSINDLSFAITSVDILFHLKREEFLLAARDMESPKELGDGAMTNLCSYLLEQRSFYPLFPVPSEFSSDVNLDLSQSKGLRLGKLEQDFGGFAPNLLILPSKLRQFSKKVNNTWTINPSLVSKGNYTLVIFDWAGSDSIKEHLDIKQLKV